MDNLLIPTSIIYAKRRTIALIVNNKGEFIVRAPKNAKESEIRAFINKKQQWIIEKRTQALNSYKDNLIKLENDEAFNIFGKTYKIQLSDVKIAKLKDNLIILPHTDAKDSLKKLLKRLLKKYLEVRVAEIAKKNDFTFKSISISSAKTNWGSCGGKNTLNFTYKLALCPYPVIDYIIVHELCHTKIKNHSANFWAEVKRIYPEYKHCEKWLKTNRAIVNTI